MRMLNMFVLDLAAHILNNVNVAYIDPAATSVLLTSISGIIIAVGATAVILWRKAKKKVSQAFHIDENAHKEVEEDIVIKDDEE
jgi:energy-converting hydrogenase Eha subunit C